jgi:hypothetical protein
MDSMKRTIRRFLDINMAMSSEKNFDRLLPRLLGETLSAADADAGILYLADNDMLHRQPQSGRWNNALPINSGNIRHCRSAAQPPAELVGAMILLRNEADRHA